MGMRVRMAGVVGALVLGAGLIAAAAAAPLPATGSVTLPVREASGEQAQMLTPYFLPPGPGPFPVVLFSHGRAPGAADRAQLKRGVSEAQLRYWLAHGVAVVAPLRPGYGPSTGGDVEQSGAYHDRYGNCVSKPDFSKTTDASTLTVTAALAWIRTQPWADPRHVLLVGQSVGGLTTVAAGAQHGAEVVGYINFAGGSGGNPERSPGASCDPQQLTRMYADYGKATSVPNLWIYALNDQYWGPEEPRAWHAAFARGGSRSTFVQADAVPDGDGHGLSRHDPALWSRPVDAFLAQVDFLRPGPASPPVSAPASASAAAVDTAH